MLKGFLNQLQHHLLDDGEGWLILSDLAEHLGLRSRDELLLWIEQANLKVLSRIDTKPHHSKVFDKTDALHAARSKEVTSLWRLALK
jgi:prophage antirepressor-like protein